MTDGELKALEVIWDWGGEASVATVAKRLRVSTEYARLICRSLGEHEYIDLNRSGWCMLKGKGKLEAAKRKVSKPKKTVVAVSSQRAGKDGSLVLGY